MAWGGDGLTRYRLRDLLVTSVGEVIGEMVVHPLQTMMMTIVATVTDTDVPAARQPSQGGSISRRPSRGMKLRAVGELMTPAYNPVK